MLVERMILRSFGVGETNALACSTAGSLAYKGKTVTCSRDARVSGLVIYVGQLGRART